MNHPTTRQPQATHTPISGLCEPARYFPFESGRYELKAGLYQLGTDFGNGTRDSRVFQIDNNWPVYRTAKLESRAEDLMKYVRRNHLPDPLETRVIGWMIRQLPVEYPGLFVCARENHGTSTLHSRLSGETLVLDHDGRLVEVHTRQRIDPPYASALDALACQIQEDLALITVDSDGRDRLCALHLCFPNHWAARDKIGRSFGEVHDPVPGIDRISRRIPPVLDALVERGPFVRFAWGLATDRRLNHHPEPPAGTNAQAWTGRRFDPEHPVLYLRIERQVTTGFPGHNAFLFAIRTYFEDVASLPDDRLAQLQDAIISMSPAALRYKGLERDRDAVMRWLSGLRRR